MRSELSAIIATDVIRRTMKLEQPGQHRQNIIALEFALDMDRQASARVLIDHGEHAERLAVMGAVHDKVITPYMAAALRTQPYA